jgi:hypothetical protein
MHPPWQTVFCDGGGSRKVETQVRTPQMVFMQPQRFVVPLVQRLRVMEIPVRIRQTRMHSAPGESPPGFKCQTQSTSLTALPYKHLIEKSR